MVSLEIVGNLFFCDGSTIWLMVPQYVTTSLRCTSLDVHGRSLGSVNWSSLHSSSRFQISAGVIMLGKFEAIVITSCDDVELIVAGFRIIDDFKISSLMGKRFLI